MKELVMKPRVRPTPPNPVDIWHAEHVYFQRLLRLLHRQVDVFETGQRPNYQLMLDILTYLREYSDVFHHPREDVAFAQLAKRCPDMAPLLANLRQEHRVIATAGEKLVALLTAILDDSVVPRADVEAAAATYLVYYRGHIAAEESSVLARAEDSLTEEDWDAVNAAVPPQPDPLFGPDPAQHLRELRHQIALESWP
jgi:hemerythrin-like domain-containing protein